MQELDSIVSDILVIGAGGCGLMAALVAAKKGARVLLLEKTDKPGGGTAFSSKGIRAAGSRRQRELKIDDSPELYAQDILRRNNNESDARLDQQLTETSGRVADFLTDVAGIEFQIGEFAFGHGAQRSHSWKADKTITDFLFEAVEREKNIQVRFSTPVLSLKQDASGAVTGVATKDSEITARKIILASGGYGASAELLSRYIPKAVDIPFPGHHGSTGDGIKMGLAIGAVTENMGAFQPYPAYIGPGKRAVAPEMALSGGIMVDAGGKRFVDETRYPGGLGIKMLDLPGKQAYEIFDERIYQLHRNAPGLRNLSGLFDAGLLLKAETPKSLQADWRSTPRDSSKRFVTTTTARRAAAKTLSDARCRNRSRTLLRHQSDGGAVPHPRRVEGNPRRSSAARRRLDHSQSLRRRRSGSRRIGQGLGRLSTGQRVARFARARHESGGARGGRAR